MRCAKPLLACSCLAMLVACTSSGGDVHLRAEPDPPQPHTQPRKVSTLDELMADDEQLEALALDCQGALLHERLAGLSPRELERLTTVERTSLRLLAIWEHDRRFAADGTLAPTSVERLTSMLEAKLGQAPPRWWVEQLASAERHDGQEPPYYDVGITEGGDRRGAWQLGPGTTHVRPEGAMLLSETSGKLSYDFSMGRVVLAPLPAEPGTMIEHARVQGATTVYYASFSPGSGGFRFPLHAVGSDGTYAWTTEVCGPDRKILGGLGHLTAEIVVLDRGARIAVFTAESHGVALDVFDPKHGTRTLAWSSDFWFAR